MCKPIQITVLGDYNVGKHSLIRQFIFKRFGGNLVKPIYEDYDYFVKIDMEIINLKIVVVAKDLTREKPFECCIKSDIFTHADIVLLCFSMISSESLQNIVQKWAIHVQLYCRKDTPMLLVGTQCDLLQDTELIGDLHQWLKQPVSTEEARKVMEQYGFKAYIETSARLVINVQKVFEVAAKTALEQKKNNKVRSWCCLK